MACNVTLMGIALDCGTNLSGIKAIYLANDSSVGDPAVGDPGVTVTDGEITAIDASAGTFYEYIPAKNTGSLTKTLTKDESTGVMYYTNEVVAQFNKMETPKRKEISNIDRGRFKAVVLDSNGKYWFLGYNNYVSATAVTGQTGAGIDDGNFYTLTLTDISAELPYEVQAEVIAGIVAE